MPASPGFQFPAHGRSLGCRSSARRRTRPPRSTRRPRRVGIPVTGRASRAGGATSSTTDRPPGGQRRLDRDEPTTPRSSGMVASQVNRALTARGSRARLLATAAPQSRALQRGSGSPSARPARVDPAGAPIEVRARLVQDRFRRVRRRSSGTRSTTISSHDSAPILLSSMVHPRPTPSVRPSRSPLVEPSRVPIPAGRDEVGRVPATRHLADLEVAGRPPAPRLPSPGRAACCSWRNRGFPTRSTGAAPSPQSRMNLYIVHAIARPAGVSSGCSATASRRFGSTLEVVAIRAASDGTLLGRSVTRSTEIRPPATSPTSKSLVVRPCLDSFLRAEPRAARGAIRVPSFHRREAPHTPGPGDCTSGTGSTASFGPTSRRVGIPVKGRASRAGGATSSTTDWPHGGQRALDRDSCTTARPSRQCTSRSTRR